MMLSMTQLHFFLHKIFTPITRNHYIHIYVQAKWRCTYSPTDFNLNIFQLYDIIFYIDISMAQSFKLLTYLLNFYSQCCSSYLTYTHHNIPSFLFNLTAFHAETHSDNTRINNSCVWLGFTVILNIWTCTELKYPVQHGVPGTGTKHKQSGCNGCVGKATAANTTNWLWNTSKMKRGDKQITVTHTSKTRVNFHFNTMQEVQRLYGAAWEQQTSGTVGGTVITYTNSQPSIRLNALIKNHEKCSRKPVPP
jgi:hypothetical protein